MEIPIILRRLLTVLACLLGLAMLTSCNSGNGVGASPLVTRVRVINLVPNAASIQVQLDNDAPFVSNLAFEEVTQYLEVGMGIREFKVSTDGGQTNTIDFSANLLQSVDYTFVVFGPVEAVAQTLLIDTTTVIPNGGTFDLRVINVATGISAVDVYLTQPGVDLSVTAPTVANVGFGNTSAYFPATPANSELRITPTGTKRVIYDAQVGTFGDKSLAEAIVFGKGSANLANAAVLNIDESGTGQVFDNTLAELKVLNGSSAGTLNVFVDGTLTLANVPFAGVSNYQRVLAGTRTVTVESATSPGATLLTLEANLQPATDTSIALSGPAGELRSLVLADNNLPSAINRARVRFVNASPDLAAMDVYVNFVRLFTNVASNGASPYAEIQADLTGTSYEFDFNVAGTTTPVLKLPGVTLLAGKTYTIYVVGSAAALQGVVSQDD